jgi:hypothetical protein
MGLVKPSVFLAVILQLYYLFACSVLWFAIASDGGVSFRRFDEGLLEVLGIAKVIVAPVSFVLLVARPRAGKIFTGIAFLGYGIGGLSMPLIAQSQNPMAWWPNASGLGEGPLMSLVWTTLGLVLVFHERIIKSLADPAPEPAPPPSNPQ